MLKTFAIMLTASALGVGTADAKCPCRCSSPCTTTTEPAAAAPAPASTAQAPDSQRTYRSFSYEPSQRTFSAPMMRGSRGSGSGGFRDAGSKIRGNYGF